MPPRRTDRRPCCSTVARALRAGGGQVSQQQRSAVGASTAEASGRSVVGEDSHGQLARPCKGTRSLSVPARKSTQNQTPDPSANGSPVAAAGTKERWWYCRSEVWVWVDSKDKAPHHASASPWHPTPAIPPGGRWCFCGQSATPQSHWTSPSAWHPSQTASSSTPASNRCQPIRARWSAGA